MKLSCVGSMGLSFVGTLRATQIRHDWKSKKERGRTHRTCGGEKRRQSRGCNKEDRPETEEIKGDGGGGREGRLGV